MGRRKKEPEVIEEESFRLRGLLTVAGSTLGLLALITFTDGDSSRNVLGLLGYVFGWLSLWTLGISAYPLLLFSGWLGWRWVFNKSIGNLPKKALLVGLLCCSLSFLATVLSHHYGSYLDSVIGRLFYSEYIFSRESGQQLRLYLGGLPAYWLYLDLPGYPLRSLLSDSGILLLFGATFGISSTLLLHLRAPSFPERPNLELGRWVKLRGVTKRQDGEELLAIEPEKDLTERPSLSRKKIKIAEDLEEELPVEKKSSKKKKAKKERPVPTPHHTTPTTTGDFTLPAPSLLTPAKKIDQSSLKKNLKRQAEVLEETLLSFGIEAKVGEINCGPTITSFEVHPSIGVKVQKIKALEHDLALNLEARSIRIIAPIPGKAAVGIEVPNPTPQEVGFRELLTAYQAQEKKCQLPLLLGKQVNGDIVINDLAKMPHLIIAGATGSGKSVCINTIVMSLVMNMRPDEVRLLMVDPKKVELTPYTHLPHMLAPVITEPQGACSALNWLVQEMEQRYEMLKAVGARNIVGFNGRKRNVELEEALDIDLPERLPYMVGIIDELADLMMVSQNDIETPIARIAQMARAVGIHLILATQRPSREVLTGLIKANFPTRIAFKVSSRINSQIVLDGTGAETLLGNGDMLFLPPGTATLIRAQGAFIRDEDLNEINDHLCRQSPPNYLINNFDALGMEEVESVDTGPRDTLYDQAVETVVQAGSASTSFLQRKLKIGYTRAASLIDELEANGVVGGADGAKPRKLLIGKGEESENEF